MNIVIETKDLAFSYNSEKLIRFSDLSLSKGQHTLILGESGSGKTTLLHLLGGLLTSYRGTINLQGINTGLLSEVARDRFRGEHLGFVFQKNHLIAAANVMQNLMISSYCAGQKFDRDRAIRILSELGMTAYASAKVSQLSYGQAQRVAIARAIINRPCIILADEPTSALDDKNCEHIIRLLLRIADEHEATLVISTHDQRLKSEIKNQILL